MSKGDLTSERTAQRGRVLALVAALLGWMFDGFEMGLFPVIARPALTDLLSQGRQLSAEELEGLVGTWNGIAIAAFLIGAAAGGVLFGWLGDRIGRVRAMSLSILTYALVSGMGAFAESPWQIVFVRFIAALGMGGEWSLGVALVMEVWQGKSRALLAGLIGAAANAGYALVALLSLGLGSLRASISEWGLSDSWVEWRLLMLCGVLPAFLTLFIRQFVPESRTWEQERKRSAVSAWATRDLTGVFIGVAACWGVILLWSQPVPTVVRVAGTLVALAIAGLGYLYPASRYLSRSNTVDGQSAKIIRRMLVGALLSGVPLLGTWAAVQWAPTWADQISNKLASAKGLTQLCSACGSMVGGFMGAMLGMRWGRRPAYIFLCLLSLGSVWLFYQTNSSFGPWFLTSVFIMGACTATFYGWLPLYLPELFPTRIRATGQGFSFNFGRILAAIGALQTGAIMSGFQGGYPQACSIMGSIYVAGLAVIWLAPETHNQPLPE
jgi:MFS transporter, SHS family, sialic acid transporter